MGQPRVFFTSDLHLGHALVSQERGFASTDDHDAFLADQWDALIRREDDLVWILGDISAGGSSATRNALAWIARRPGRKGLILGNHDPLHPMYRNAHKAG